MKPMETHSRVSMVLPKGIMGGIRKVVTLTRSLKRGIDLVRKERSVSTQSKQCRQIMSHSEGNSAVAGKG
jgi:hypothetical protein